jgi:hypothetical protein
LGGFPQTGKLAINDNWNITLEAGRDTKNCLAKKKKQLNSFGLYEQQRIYPAAIYYFWFSMPEAFSDLRCISRKVKPIK